MERKLCFEIRKLDNEVRRGIDAISPSRNIESMTAMHGWVIGFLIENDDREIYQRDLEETLKIRPSSVTSLLKLMEKNGLIVRESVESDGRLKRIKLTQKAYECKKQFGLAVEKLEKRMTKGVTQKDLDTFYAVVAKFRNNLKTEENQ